MYLLILGDCFLIFLMFTTLATLRLHKLSLRHFVPRANLSIFLTPIEVGVNLKDGYNGDISARDAGRIGGQMVKKLI